MIVDESILIYNSSGSLFKIAVNSEVLNNTQELESSDIGDIISVLPAYTGDNIHNDTVNNTKYYRLYF